MDDTKHLLAAPFVRSDLSGCEPTVRTCVRDGGWPNRRLIGPAALAGKPVLLLATGGGGRPALVTEHALRPLIGFFEAQTLAATSWPCARTAPDPRRS